MDLISSFPFKLDLLIPLNLLDFVINYSLPGNIKICVDTCQSAKQVFLYPLSSHLSVQYVWTEVNEDTQSLSIYYNNHSKKKKI